MIAFHAPALRARAALLVLCRTQVGNPSAQCTLHLRALGFEGDLEPGDRALLDPEGTSQVGTAPVLAHLLDSIQEQAVLYAHGVRLRLLPIDERLDVGDAGLAANNAFRRAVRLLAAVCVGAAGPTTSGRKIKLISMGQRKCVCPITPAREGGHLTFVLPWEE